MSIEDSYVVQIPDHNTNEFILDLVALSQKYNVSITPMNATSTTLYNQQFIPKEMRSNNEFIKLLKESITQSMLSRCVESDLISYTITDSLCGSYIQGNVTVITPNK